MKAVKAMKTMMDFMKPMKSKKPNMFPAFEGASRLRRAVKPPMKAMKSKQKATASMHLWFS